VVPLIRGKILEPDAFISAHLQERTLDLVGTLLGGSDRGAASAGDALADDADDDNIHMNDDPVLDGTSLGHDPLADDLSDITRAQARRWCQDLLNLGRFHTGAECIGMLSLLFNLTESQTLTMISVHLYGSSLKEESPDELLLGLANRYWEDWSEFLVDSNTSPPTNKAKWKELHLELQEVFSLRSVPRPTSPIPLRRIDTTRMPRAYRNLSVLAGTPTRPPTLGTLLCYRTSLWRHQAPSTGHSITQTSPLGWQTVWPVRPGHVRLGRPGNWLG